MNFLEILTEFFPRLLSGAGLTLQLTFTAYLIGAAVVLPLAIVRNKARQIWQAPIRIYISFMRGTPLIAQLFLVYYGTGQFRLFFESIGLWGFFSEPYSCAVFTFTLNTIAYQTEILRGGLQNVPDKEVEAGKAIGMNLKSLYSRIILQHAYRIGFPALGNEFIFLLKASAIVGVVTIYDLLGTTRAIFAQTFDFSVYIWSAIAYVMITGIFVYLWRMMEKWLSPHMYVSSKKQKIMR